MREFQFTYFWAYIQLAMALVLVCELLRKQQNSAKRSPEEASIDLEPDTAYDLWP